MSTVATNDVVETLLSVREGDRLTLEAERYEFKSPFEVTDVDEQSWRAPGDRVWRSRRVTVESQPEGRGRKSVRDLDVYPAAPAPEWGSYGRLVTVESADEETGTEDEIDEDRCPWLERDARDIVYDAPVTRTLEEVLNAVERQDNILDVHQRLGAGTLKKTKALLWELGLRDQAGRLLEDDELQDRVAELREVYVDE